MAAADYLSTQLTSIDAGTYQPSTIAAYKVGSKDMPIFRGSFSTGSIAKSKTIEMVRLPSGCIPYRLWFNTDTSLGSSKVAFGSSATADKYRASGTLTTPLSQWIPFMVLPLVKLTAEELVWITNDGTADLPAAWNIEFAFEVIIP
jgi:hypothetical protein